MKIKDYKNKSPYLLCETLSGRYIHLYIPVKWHMKTLCRRVVYKKDGFSGSLNRVMCQKCLDKANISDIR